MHNLSILSLLLLLDTLETVLGREYWIHFSPDCTVTARARNPIAVDVRCLKCSSNLYCLKQIVTDVEYNAIAG